MSEYDEFENFIVFDCANLISRNRVHSNIDNFAPQYIRDATKGVREMGYDSVALLKNSAYVWAYKNHDGSEEMKILNELIQKEKVIVIDVEDDDRMIIEYAIAENGLILTKDKFRDHEEKFSPEKWADVKSRMYREFEVIGEKFIAPGLPKRELTKDQQMKHKYAEKGMRRPPTVQKKTSNFLRFFRNLRQPKQQEQKDEVKVINCLNEECKKKVKFTNREIEPFTCPHCFTRQDPIKGEILPPAEEEEVNESQNESKSEEDKMKEELKNLKIKLDVTEKVEKIKQKPKQKPKQNKKKKSLNKSKSNQTVSDELIQFIIENVPVHPKSTNEEKLSKILAEKKIPISGDEEKTISEKIKSTNSTLFVLRKNKIQVSRKSISAIFSKWIAKNIKEKSLDKKKLENLIGSFIGAGTISEKQFSSILEMENNIKSDEGMTELLQKLGYSITIAGNEFIFDLQTEEE